jgi:hypothetical protein
MSLPSVWTQVKANRLRAIAVTTAKRSSFVPDLPTVDEAGVPGYEAGQWWGVLAPAKVPAAIVAKQNSELNTILSADDMRAKLANEGAEPVLMAPDAFTRFVREEIAKFRAARTLWAEIMRTRFNAKKAESQKLRFHSQTAGSTLTAQQIENNIVRTTIEAMAAVLGGTQSLHTNGKDEALALPTEQSARTALRTQQIIAYESGIADTVDPMAGSFYVESLTSEIIEHYRQNYELKVTLSGVKQVVTLRHAKRKASASVTQDDNGITVQDGEVNV